MALSVVIRKQGSGVAVASGGLSAHVARRASLHVLVGKVGHLQRLLARRSVDDAGSASHPALTLDLLVHGVAFGLDLHVRVIPRRVRASRVGVAPEHGGDGGRHGGGRQLRRVAVGHCDHFVAAFHVGEGEAPVQAAARVDAVEFGEVSVLEVGGERVGVAVVVVVPTGAGRVLLLRAAVARVPREGLVGSVFLRVLKGGVMKVGAGGGGCGGGGAWEGDCVVAGQRLMQGAEGEVARDPLTKRPPRAHRGRAP